MTDQLARPTTTLSGLDEEQRYARFASLQERMPAVWDSIRMDFEDESVVVVPAISLDKTAAESGSLLQAMEERSLFLLLLLRQPRLRMIYVTSMPVAEDTIDYYLGLLPGVIPRHARGRLHMVSVDDSSPRSLSAKLLERPRLLARIAALIPNRQRAHLVPYNTTTLERDVALSLGIPMYAADPRHLELGSKTGCRRLFAEVGVPHPAGAEDLHDLDEVADAVVAMRRTRPGLREVIVKLNHGVAGEGNAVVNLSDVPASGHPEERDAVRGRVDAMRFESPRVEPAAYASALARTGGIVEERILGEELRSPSVQLRVLPDRSVELLSTHDQLLGGSGGQSYLGCIFPADPAYSRLITEHAQAIADRLAEVGVLGRFAVDFVVVRGEDGVWSAYAIELNLRKGGTTHPFLTLQFLTDGRYDGQGGVFLTPEGEPRHLVATDHLEHPELRALCVSDLFDIVARQGLQFDASRRTGVVFHMMSCLTEHGRIGFTAVGATAEQAWELYERTERILLEEAGQALAEPALPD